MNYLYKYLKYKQKYISLLEKINGGMSNWDKNGNLVTQIKKYDNDGNIYLVNINIVDLPEEMKNQKYNLEDELNIIKTEIIELYNLLFNEHNEDKIKILNNVLLQLQKTYNKHILEDEILRLKKDGEIFNGNLFFIKADNEANASINSLNKQSKKEKLNKLKKDLTPEQLEEYSKKTKKEKYKYLLELYIKYERGNISENFAIDNPIPLQSFTGDFSKITNSKNINAYTQDSINLIKKETGLNNDELIDIFKFFPVDGISTNTIYELKSFYKNKNNVSTSVYSRTKLYGYNNDRDLQIKNKKFKGNISYSFRYNNYGKFGNELKINNILTNIKGDIVDENNNVIKKVDIKNLKMLPENINGYDYVWIELNNNGTFMKNALNKKYFNENLLIKKEISIIDEINNILKTDYDYKEIINLKLQDFINKILRIRNRDILELYLLELEHQQIITGDDYLTILSNINEYINNKDLIPIKYKEIMEQYLSNNYLYDEEKLILNELISLQNKLINQNPILQSDYKKDKSIISKLEDTNIYPSIQINNMIKKIDEGIIYNIPIHTKRITHKING